MKAAAAIAFVSVTSSSGSSRAGVSHVRPPRERARFTPPRDGGFDLAGRFAVVAADSLARPFVSARPASRPDGSRAEPPPWTSAFATSALAVSTRAARLIRAASCARNETGIASNEAAGRRAGGAAFVPTAAPSLPSPPSPPSLPSFPSLVSSLVSSPSLFPDRPLVPVVSAARSANAAATRVSAMGKKAGRVLSVAARPHSCALENSRSSRRSAACAFRADSTLARAAAAVSASVSFTPRAAAATATAAATREVGFRPVTRPRACANSNRRLASSTNGARFAPRGFGFEPWFGYVFVAFGAPVAEGMAGVVPAVGDASAPPTRPVVVARSTADAKEARRAEGDAASPPAGMPPTPPMPPAAASALSAGTAAAARATKAPGSRGGTRSPWICLSRL